MLSEDVTLGPSAARPVRISHMAFDVCDAWCIGTMIWHHQGRGIVNCSVNKYSKYKYSKYKSHCANTN